MNQLQDELQTFEKKKPELLANSRGKFVLIKDKKTVGVFETETDAVNQGFQKFKNSPFLVKQILDTEPDYNFLSNLINVQIEAAVIAAPLKDQHIQCLIGRDVLRHGVFIYTGYINQFTLSF